MAWENRDGKIFRDGIEVQKGVAPSLQFLEENKEGIFRMLDHWISYPDCFIDIISEADCRIKLFFYQRIFLRACLRYKYHSATFTRAFSKSFLAILANIIRCIFLPHSKVVLCSAFKGQAVTILKQKYDEILQIWPFFAGEIATANTSGKDYFELTFKNFSTFVVVAMSQSSRGARSTSSVVEEGVLIDGDAFNEIVLPMAVVDRVMENGKKNPNEPQQAQVFVTSAGPKTCFMYEKLLELVQISILQPNLAFVWGGSYKVPVAMGLLNRDTIEEQRMSSTFKADSFLREYMSVWTGNNTDAWISSDRLARARKLLTAEAGYKLSIDKKQKDFYIIGVDVARSGANTAIVVIRVSPQADRWKKKIVFIKVIHDMPMPNQAVVVKQFFELYKPKEIIVDATGLGVTLIDLLVLPTDDPKTGTVYPPMRVINRDAYGGEEIDRTITPNLWVFKATAELNSEAYGNFYSQLTSGSLFFLAHEKVVKAKMMGMKKWQKKSIVDIEKFLYPYVMTSRMIDEINNLRLKPIASGKIEIEQITRRVVKDRFSALCYALWRAKAHEDKEKKKNNNAGDLKDMILFTSKERPREKASRRGRR